MARGTYCFPLISLVLLPVGLPQAGLGQQPNPPSVELREIESREAPSFTPTLYGQRVTIQGIVSTKAVNFRRVRHLPIQNREGTGAVIESGRGSLDRVCSRRGRACCGRRYSSVRDFLF